ncbi:hypothetical protein Daesc_003126 [Daldinia eschscholtzii]|uniref:Uncharacterized protein n=1 Tax=Daldinia eschscholtzii TaxID=292717 RepID=A0AAX6MSJ3_9PEZI
MEYFQSILIKLAIGLTLISATTATLNVTAVPLADGCVAYPGYDNATSTAGPLRVVADSTGKELDGFRFIPKFAIAVGGGSWGFMVIPTTENKTADAKETPFRCGNGTLQAHLNVGIQGDRWQTLIAAGTPAESVFGFGLPDLPDPNYHLKICMRDSHIVDGVVQPGVFLGAVNVTTWGFNYQNNTEAGEYYFVRLLGPNSNNLATGKPLNPGEFTGYIKITAV